MGWQYAVAFGVIAVLPYNEVTVKPWQRSLIAQRWEGCVVSFARGVTLANPRRAHTSVLRQRARSLAEPAAGPWMGLHLFR